MSINKALWINRIFKKMVLKTVEVIWSKLKHFSHPPHPHYTFSLLASSPQVAQDLLWTKLGSDVDGCCRGQQLPPLVHVQLMPLESIGVNLRQKVGANVTRYKARVGNDFSQEWNVVGHTWREDQNSLHCVCSAVHCESPFVYLW